MPEPFSRCQVIPEDGHAVRCVVDGKDRFSWHFGENVPRPYLYPVRGPSGACLTRMGHPGAPNHDHHQSVWFAHHQVMGVDFWGNASPARIRQLEWLAYEDGDEEGRMAFKLGWYDGHDPQPLMMQELVIGFRPWPDGETTIELQSTLTPTAEQLELGKTNFGLLAVRVAKSLSAYFGGGDIVDSEGRRGEPAIFGQRARWVDYSGPSQPLVIEGITFFDHPSNPGHPSYWHVREDGWMGASLCFAEPRLITRQTPLVVRYLLDLHGGAVRPDRAKLVLDRFAESTSFLVRRSQRKHVMYEVVRGPV